MIKFFIVYNIIIIDNYLSLPDRAGIAALVVEGARIANVSLSKAFFCYCEKVDKEKIKKKIDTLSKRLDKYYAV